MDQRTRPLSERAQRFIAEYIKDLKGTQAAIRAGYAPSGARAYASKMLSNVVVAKAVRDAQDKILKENQLTTARIVRELSHIAFFDPASIFDESGRLLDINELPPEIRRTLPAMEIVESANGSARRIRFAGRLQALLALGKHLAMFTRRGADQNALSHLDCGSALEQLASGSRSRAGRG